AVVLWCCFLQAQDGIRDRNVTGVQTCALPILDAWWPTEHMPGRPPRIHVRMFGLGRQDSPPALLARPLCGIVVPKLVRPFEVEEIGRASCRGSGRVRLRDAAVQDGGKWWKSLV